jgi:Tol biopolymer transport system component
MVGRLLRPPTMWEMTASTCTLSLLTSRLGTIRPVGTKAWISAGSVAWMPDGRSLVLTATESDVSQIWRLSFPAGEAQKVTNDLSNYNEVSVSQGGTMVVTQAQQNSQLWVMPSDGDAAKARQITSGSGRDDGGQGISWTPDGRIVYGSNASGVPDIWICEGDGSNARALPTGGQPNTDPQVLPDGRYVVFMSYRDGRVRIWRANIDGGSAQPLSPGPYDVRPRITDDGRFVIYSSVTAPSSMWKVPIAGGDPVQIPSSEPTATAAAVSPDGSQLAVSFNAERGWRVGVRPIDVDSAPHLLDIAVSTVQWTRDGRALTFIEAGKGSNLFNQPMPDGTPRQLTSFAGDRIFNFAWSNDGKRLALSRGSITSDVVLLAPSGYPK